MLSNEMLRDAEDELKYFLIQKYGAGEGAERASTDSGTPYTTYAWSIPLTPVITKHGIGAACVAKLRDEFGPAPQGESMVIRAWPSIKIKCTADVELEPLKITASEDDMTLIVRFRAAFEEAV